MPKEADKDNEIRTLRKALEECARLAWEGGDIDGGDFQNLMERHGLLVEVPADEAFIEEWDHDRMFVVAWHPLAHGSQMDIEDVIPGSTEDYER